MAGLEDMEVYPVTLSCSALRCNPAGSVMTLNPSGIF